MNTRTRIAAGLVGMLLMAVIPRMRAQSVDSSLQGSVLDASGALVPGANVKLINSRTGVVLATRSDGDGNYVFPVVPPGEYTLEVSKPGFATFDLRQFNVIVGQRATENATMKIASQAQTVTVDANGLANLLETQSNDLGNVIAPQSVAQLPLNGRNFLQLGLLSGATQMNAGSSNASVAQTGHSSMILSINIAGNEPDYTMYLVNGIQTVGTRAGNTSLNLSTDAIDQFEVHYGFFMPDMGTNPGIVDVITKGGTNKIHGDLYEYVRNNEMEARNYFSSVPPGPYHQNQFGATIGGPILKDKLFYFGNYEGYRQDQSAFVGAYTPTSAMFSGDFSALSTPIYDPTTYNPATGQRSQFPGNKITSINPVAKALLAYYLSGSSLTTTPNNVGGEPHTTLNSDQFTTRVDYNLNEKNQIFGQGSWLNAPNTVPGLFPSQGTSYPMDTEFVGLGWTWTLSPTKVNALRLGMVRDSVYDQGVSIPGIQNTLGITGTEDPNGVPGINITGYTGFGTSTGLLGDIDNSYQIHDSFDWLRGNHQIKFGADLGYIRSVQSSANANARGVFTFNDVFTAQTSLNPTTGKVSQVAGTGNAFADFLLGDLVSAQSIGMPRTHFRWTTFEPYIQDTWKLRHDLNANLALAYFINTPPDPPDQNNTDLIHGFNFATGQETFAALGTANPEVFPITKNDFAPRLGLTWQPGFAKNTVIRAGWGLYYTTQMDLNSQYSVVSEYITVNNAISNATNVPNPTYQLGDGNAMPPVTVGQITAAEVPTISGTIQYLAANQHPPIISQWNLDIQHTFAQSSMLDVAYIGNEAHHLAKNWDPWDCSAPGSQVCNPAANNPYYPKYSYMQEVNSISNGRYNGLLVKFQRQFSHGLSILGNYTWAKSLTDSQEGSNGTLNQDKSCFRCDYGLSASDVPQSLVISAVAELPVGRGRYIGGNMNRGLDEVVGGWSVDAITTMQKGNPFTITAPNNTPWSPAQIRADQYCNGRNALSNKNLRGNGLYWINTGSVASVSSPCYVSPTTDPHNTSGTAWAFGTEHFDPLIGPGLNNWDMGVHKLFPIRETMNFTLRGEFFNAWNHAQFANPNGSVTSATFGQVSATQGFNQQRVIQVAGNFSF